MTLIEVIDSARDLINEPLSRTTSGFPDNSTSFWTDGRLTTFHNLIQSELQNELVQSFEDYFVTQTTITTVNGSADYDLPTDFLKMRRVEDLRGGGETDPQEIIPITLNEKDDVFAFNLRSSVGFGGGYYILANKIVFGATPTDSQASAIRLHYVQRIPDISNASDSSQIPAEYHHALVLGVVKYAHISQQSPEAATTALEYEKLIAKMRRQAEQRQIQRSRRVKRKKRDGINI